MQVDTDPSLVPRRIYPTVRPYIDGHRRNMGNRASPNRKLSKFPANNLRYLAVWSIKCKTSG
jgi:hypothetical protein